MEELLSKLNACEPAIEWAKGKTWQEIYTTCHRGDWLLWLFARTNPNDLQRLTLAKGHCAATVRHLMTDPRSVHAVDVAIAFGEGRANSEGLKAAADAAADAHAAAYSVVYAAAAAAEYAEAAAAEAVAAAAAAAEHAVTVATAVATAAEYAEAVATTTAAAEYAHAVAAAYAESAAVAVATAAYTGDKQNRLLTAEICRKYLPIEIWNIN